MALSDREPAITSPTGTADIGADGGEFKDIPSDKPLELASDWDHVFRQFNLDPNVFEVIDDTIRCSTWQQSKRLENGERDIVQLYSYRARFRRKLAGMVDPAEVIASLREWKPRATFIASTLGEPVTFRDGWADWQLGKGEGDGTAGTKQRVLDGFEKTLDRVKKLRSIGVNVNDLLVANMGDITEAVTGHYTSQTYSVDLNLRDQIALAIELSLTGLKAYVSEFETVTKSFCLCNHGQWQRLGGKQFTDDSDNSTGAIGDTLQVICSMHPDLSGIEFIIPRDEMITTGRFSGVNVAMAHGHKIGGNEETWLTKQAAWLLSERNFRVELWATAHRHTASLDDFGPFHRIQDTTVDPGSKSFTDGTGKFSTRGKTTYVISSTYERKFDHYAVL
jgi:hypothetical protein